MTGEPTASNRARTFAFRDELLLYLHEEGFPEATQRPALRGLAFAQRAKADPADIVGLGWSLTVRRQQTIDLSDALDSAKLKAAWAGKKLYAAVHYRKAHGVGESYVTMPVSVFIEVLRATPTVT